MYSIRKIKEDTATKIWENSPNSTIFNNPFFLKHYNDIEIYGVYKGEELWCCWPIKIETKTQITTPSFFYYFGPFWSSKILELPNHSWLKYSSEVYEIFIKTFTKKFKIINFDLHYSLDDVRIFDWWNYNSSNPKFEIFPRYTAVIDQLKLKSESQISREYRYVRRYELKHFEKYKKNLEEYEINLDDLLYLYFDTVKIEEKNKKKQIINDISLIFKIAKSEHGKILSYRSKDTKKIICIMILLFDKKSSHLVISLAEKEWKKKGIITWATHKSIIYSKNKNMDIFDFNGANSPLRGDSKHSFGSKGKLFFNLKYKS